MGFCCFLNPSSLRNSKSSPRLHLGDDCKLRHLLGLKHYSPIATLCVIVTVCHTTFSIQAEVFFKFYDMFKKTTTQTKSQGIVINCFNKPYDNIIGKCQERQQK